MRELAVWQREQIVARDLTVVMHEIELPLVPVLRSMELEGVRLNTARMREITTRVRDEVHDLELEIWRLAGTEFVIGSPQQLGEILFNKLALSKKRRGKTGFSTDARVLQAIRARARDHPADRALARAQPARQDVLLACCRSSPPPIPESRIHTTFLQAAATTGRLASTDPNMQNVPIRTDLGREVRGCFEAAPGQRPAERRLLADRAARARAHRRRARAQGDLRARRGRPHRDGLEGLRHAARAARPRPALEGEDGQLRDRLRPVGLRPRRPPRHPARGGQGDHRHVPRALSRRCARSSRRRSRRRRPTATSRPCGAAGGRSPSSRRATGRCARSASGSRSTPSSRARRRTS